MTNAESNPNATLAAHLFRQYGTAVRQSVASFGKQVAEDATSYAFLQVLRGKLAADHSAPEGWLKTVARNEALRLVGYGDPHPAPLSLELHPAWADTADTDSVDPAFVAEIDESLQLLRHLKPAEATVLFHLWAGYSYKETAAKLGKTYTWVNRYAVEGRAHMRRLQEGGE